MEKEKRTKRPKSKIAVAKKILNKNVKTNTKIVFDEEGEVRRHFTIQYFSIQ